MGEMLVQAPDSEPANIVADCDLQAAELMRREWPFFRDRRIDAYAPLQRDSSMSEHKALQKKQAFTS